MGGKLAIASMTFGKVSTLGANGVSPRALKVATSADAADRV